MLASRLDVAHAQTEHDHEARIAKARADAEASRLAAIAEARSIVEAAAARAKMAEDEVGRVRAEAGAQLKEAVARARAESDAELQAQVARAQAETEARLEKQLANVIGEAEQARHAHRQVTADADRIRLEATEAARAGAEAALASETARIRAEANQRLEMEVARLRDEAARMQAERVEELALLAPQERSERISVLADMSRTALRGIRWDFVATAALILLIVVAGAIYLPRAVSTAAKTSSALVGTAGKAAKDMAQEAAAAAPVVTRRALNAAERAIPRPEIVTAKTERAAARPDPAAAAAAADTGPGFVAVFSRIPMDVYADGARIGTTEDGQLLLKSGAHRLEFVSERFRYRSSTTLTVRPGLVQPFTVTLPSAELRITTTPGAEVWVEGERVGVAPFAPVQVPIGTREIVVKNTAGAEKRQAIEVKYGATNEISVVLQNGSGAESPAAPHLAPLNQYQPK